MASQTITGPELQYTQDNKRCFANSGQITNAAGGGGSPSTLLEFTSDSGYIVAKIVWSVAHGGGSDSYYYIKLDDVIIYSATQTTTGGAFPSLPVKIIVPPFTKVTVEWGIDAVTEKGTAIFIGRVYEYLPVRN